MSEDSSAWHPEVLPAAWPRAARDLERRGALSGFYLAGGTGLALQHGHRRSVDLDLFREAGFDSRTIGDRLRGQRGLERVALEHGTVDLVLHGVQVSFLHYPYPLLFPLRSYGALSVADARDIACMKVQAIGDRGTRRDFVDLYVAAREHGLDQILDWFSRKYAAAAYSRAHYLKAMTYFRDAEQDAEPDLLAPIEWRSVTGFFLSQVPRLAHLS
ncbi:MAG: nucleotidyl transferase AbiEii/AbiGii toxin family protein [Acidimicrobiia bacterium]|nr:nucleotidyl transferase AbiEii/AbiGii toxin family protein [Acidimicrobiia bacterium]